MNFFYKNEKLKKNSEVYSQLLKTGAELVSVMYNKLKDTGSDYRIFKHFYQEDGEDKTSFFIGEYNQDRKEISTIFTPRGELIFARIEKSKIGTFTEVNLDDVRNYIDKDILVTAHQIYDDFCVKRFEKVVKDKYGEEYTLRIIENADSSVSKDLYISSVLIFKDKEKVGYLKSCYTTTELTKKYEKDEQNPYFENVGNVDYSRISDSCRDKGLGYLLYFHMSQFLNEKGIEFRQSSLCSPEAKRMWKKMSEHWSEHVTDKVIKGSDDKIVKFLAIAQNYYLEFIEEKVILKKLKI